MQRASKLIKANLCTHPACAYYLPLLGKARRNVKLHPDICVETCKAVLEGISKTIVLALDSSTIRRELDGKDVDQLVKMAAKALKANDDVVEDNFVTRATSLANALAALRNTRGDISHGKAVPKLESSTTELAKLCLQMTDAIAFYMLDSFYKIAAGQPTRAPVLADSKVDTPTGLPDIGYEANPSFNDQLDMDNPLPGKVLYSAALYNLYYEDYIIELTAFQDAAQDDAETGEGVSA